MWTSIQCPNNVDEGSTMLTGATTSYTINNLRKGTLYAIYVTATNAVSSEQGSHCYKYKSKLVSVNDLHNLHSTF